MKDVPAGYENAVLVPEEDVLDTWATSSMTPQLATELFRDHPVYEQLFPMSLRPQSHDIITFWLFNTLVKSQLHYGKNPWKEVVISGFALDPHGKKMSKSKGNVVHPQEMIRKYGADALRFWAAGSKLGEDLPFQEKDLVTGKKTITKLWNAAKFVLMNLEGYDGFKAEWEELEIMDRWILTTFNSLVRRCTRYMDDYEYAKARHEIEQFFWGSFCDNYLEISKGRLYEPNDTVERTSAQYALSEVLLGILKLFAPYMPFVTDRIYGLLPFKNKERSIHLTSWPVFRDDWKDTGAAAAGEDIVRIVQAVRKWKSEQQLSMGAPLEHLSVSTPSDIRLAENDLVFVTKASSLSRTKGEFSITIE